MKTFIIAMAMLLVCCKKECPPEHLVFTAAFSGLNEIPPNGEDATGNATIVVDLLDSSAIYEVFVFGIDSVTGEHLHVAEVGVSGGVGVNLLIVQPPFMELQRKILAHRTQFGAEDFVGPLKGKSFSGFLEILEQGLVYSNIHTVEIQAGATRGQLHKFIAR